MQAQGQGRDPSVGSTGSARLWKAGRAFLASALTVAGSFVVFAPPDAQADCTLTEGPTGFYTVPSGTYTTCGISETGSAASSSSSAKAGPSLSLTSYGNILLQGAADTVGLYLQSNGGAGSSEGASAAAGGTVTLVNNGEIKLEGVPTTSGYKTFGLWVQTNGGAALTTTGSQGGRGGDGGLPTIGNNGQISIWRGMPSGGAVIFAESLAGPGGDSSDTGGNSGDSKMIAITNTAPLSIGEAGREDRPPLFTGGRVAGWGIGAIGAGSTGGLYDGSGGTGAPIQITNKSDGEIGIYWIALDETADGLRGIFAASLGSDGIGANSKKESGGKGEAGYQITVANEADITIENRGQTVTGTSAGILAISQGGDGGDAEKKGTGGVGGGGSETSGNVNSLLQITHSFGDIATYGDNIFGINAQSRGGNGGSGTSGDKDSSGGNGGVGGAVQIDLLSSSRIETYRDGSYGILAQSVGGLGGAGGDASAALGKGGGGGYGGDAGKITVTLDLGTLVRTIGDFSTAVTVHSIGGGGGTGGDFTDVLGGGGGNGGNGGNGAAVTVNSNSALVTRGDNSYGILAQSIGSSGGTGGIAEGLTLELGGDGGAGGAAGDATVTNGGSIETHGDYAHAIVAQSINGGGGAAGSAGGSLAIGGTGGATSTAKKKLAGTTISVTNEGTVSTAGTASIGILAQSVGGGGGTGGGATGIGGIGGSGSAGGAGGAVTVYSYTGGITTEGELSHGILAHSIGGGGGNGGNITDISVGVGIGVGGSASGGGLGGAVTVTNVNPDGSSPQAVTIGTSGGGAIGILAQSVGGGGGNGGSAVGAGLDLGSFQLGGSAGGGGDSNQVTVEYDGLALTTGGSHAAGIVAQSIGGGGGNGGSASSYDASIGFQMGTTVGGAGGKGGSASSAVTTIDGTSETYAAGVFLSDTTIQTNKDNHASNTDAVGIFVQSIGGGGGNGGTSVADALTLAIPTGEGASLAANITTAVGGSGGTGGDGGDAVAILAGSTSVATYGTGAHGVVVQSIGGGGGNGGSASTLSAILGDEDTVSATVDTSIGGSGGKGGYGKEVTVSLEDTASVTTNGDFANAVVAQSIGGGGGNGGIGGGNSFELATSASIKANSYIGGSGGTGGGADDVTVTADVDSVITTYGSESRGILAQVIGGGGGTSQGGSVSVSASAGPDAEEDDDGGEGNMSVGLTVGVGRSGGTGAAGGEIELDTYGTITTSGDGADGVLAQSIGGGGGLGGSISNQAPPGDDDDDDSDTTYTLKTGVGGTGGTGGDGGVVKATFNSRITTSGEWADAFVLQSIGGGGGVGGSSTVEGSRATAGITVSVGGQGGIAGNGGNITLNLDGALPGNQASTTGYAAHGIVVQTIGGGGGMGGDGSDQAAGSITVGSGAGGSGGTAGSGGTITITQDGWSAPQTEGDDAYGLLLQSIGGGGGIAGAGNATSSDEDGSHQLDVVVGGAGGAGGDGGTITFDAGLGVATSGDRAFGFVAQSIGGGGGVGGAGSADSLTSLTVGGDASGGGDGGQLTITVKKDSTITTSGKGAHALIAQSIGGGGGIGGAADGGPLSLGNRSNDGGPNNGSGKPVSVDVNATIKTTGERAFGVLAQSIGGGGGYGGDANGTFAGRTQSSGGGESSAYAQYVDVTQSGTITTSGEGSVGIFAQSEGPAYAGNIAVTINGTVTGGTGSDGAGVFIVEGDNGSYNGNVLTVSSGGSLTAGDSSAYAYLYKSDLTASEGGGLQVVNSGTISGNHSISAGGDPAGQVDNQEGGAIVDAATIAAAQINNRGRLFIGSSGSVDRTRIDGSFAQFDSGRMVATADFAAGEADLLTVAGDAQLSGQVAVEAMAFLPNVSLAIVETGGRQSGTLTPLDTPLFSYALDHRAQSVSLSVSGATFADPALGLNAAQASAAGQLQSIWNAGGGDYGRFFGTLNSLAETGGSDYADALSDLSPGLSLAAATTSVAQAIRHADEAMSCPTFQGDTALVVESTCYWAQVGGSHVDQYAFEGTEGFDGTLFDVSGGAQMQIAENWFLGVLAGYEYSAVSGKGGYVTSDGDAGYGGLALKYQTEPWLFAAAVSGSYGWFDTDRNVSIPGYAGTAEGSFNAASVNGRVRAAYTFATDRYYVKPLVDLDLTYARASSYTESGAGILDLSVDASDLLAFRATPAVEVGAGFHLTAPFALDLRAYARPGLTVGTPSEWTTTARLAQAPAGSGSFDSALPLARVAGRLGLGLQALSVDGLSVRVQYDGTFADTYRSQGGSLRISQRF